MSTSKPYDMLTHKTSFLENNYFPKTNLKISEEEKNFNFTNLFNVWLDGRQLESHIPVYIQSTVMWSV